MARKLEDVSNARTMSGNLQVDSSFIKSPSFEEPPQTRTDFAAVASMREGVFVYCVHSNPKFRLTKFSTVRGIPRYLRYRYLVQYSVVVKCPRTKCSTLKYFFINKKIVLVPSGTYLVSQNPNLPKFSYSSIIEVG